MVPLGILWNSFQIVMVAQWSGLDGAEAIEFGAGLGDNCITIHTVPHAFNLLFWTTFCHPDFKSASRRLKIYSCVLQDIGPLGPLPCSHSTTSLDHSKQGTPSWPCAILGWLVSSWLLKISEWPPTLPSSSASTQSAPLHPTMSVCRLVGWSVGPLFGQRPWRGRWPMLSHIWGIFSFFLLFTASRNKP